MTLEERVAALEEQMAAIQGEGDYTLNRSGETIDAIMDGIEDAAIYHGTQVVEVTTNPNYVDGYFTLPAGFTPTIDTKIVASLRIERNPGPFGLCLNVNYHSGRLRYMIFWGGITGVDMGSIPNGTYYVDWICIDKGV